MSGSHRSFSRTDAAIHRYAHVRDEPRRRTLDHDCFALETTCVVITIHPTTARKSIERFQSGNDSVEPGPSWRRSSSRSWSLAAPRPIIPGGGTTLAPSWLRSEVPRLMTVGGAGAHGRRGEDHFVATTNRARTCIDPRRQWVTDANLFGSPKHLPAAAGALLRPRVISRGTRGTIRGKTPTRASVRIPTFPNKAGSVKGPNIPGAWRSPVVEMFT
jgi:hypothetical protein